MLLVFLRHDSSSVPKALSALTASESDEDEESTPVITTNNDNNGTSQPTAPMDPDEKGERIYSIIPNLRKVSVDKIRIVICSAALLLSIRSRIPDAISSYKSLPSVVQVTIKFGKFASNITQPFPARVH